MINYYNLYFCGNLTFGLPSKRARKPLDLGALDSDNDIVSGNTKLPELVVLDSDDDIAPGSRSVSDIENGIFEEIARLDSLNQ